MNHLVRPIMYDAYHHIENLSQPDAPAQKCDVYGNICETGDLLAKNREIPQVSEGDLLSISTAGAYSYCMASLYNLRPLPTEVIADRGELKLARQALSTEELIGQILDEAGIQA